MYDLEPETEFRVQVRPFPFGAWQRRAGGQAHRQTDRHWVVQVGGENRHGRGPWSRGVTVATAAAKFQPPSPSRESPLSNPRRPKA